MSKFVERRRYEGHFCAQKCTYPCVGHVFPFNIERIKCQAFHAYVEKRTHKCVLCATTLKYGRRWRGKLGKPAWISTAMCFFYAETTIYVHRGRNKFTPWCIKCDFNVLSKDVSGDICAYKMYSCRRTCLRINANVTLLHAYRERQARPLEKWERTCRKFHTYVYCCVIKEKYGAETMKKNRLFWQMLCGHEWRRNI